jgi:hypothetical protein
MNHGGKRQGAGRPKSDDPRILVNFTLSRQIVEHLRSTVAPRERSAFVEKAISALLGRSS